MGPRRVSGMLPTDGEQLNVDLQAKDRVPTPISLHVPAKEERCPPTPSSSASAITNSWSGRLPKSIARKIKDGRKQLEESLLELTPLAEDESSKLGREVEKVATKIRSLRKEIGYFPRMEVPAIRSAAEKGALFDLLEAVSDLPLAQLPVLAREHIRFYSRHLDHKNKIDKPDYGYKDPLEAGLHVLLSNYITVPGPAAEEMLEEVVEEVLVKDVDDSDEVPTQYEANPEFPKHLRPLFFKRWLVDAEFDEEKHKLLIDGMLYDLSPLEDITLTDEIRGECKIPLFATQFAFVYNGAAVPTGAFVYLNSKRKVIGMNVIEACHLPNAYAFGTAGPVNKEALTSLEETSCPHTVTIESLRDKGVMQYAWVGPTAQKKHGLKPAEKGLYNGGFAYFFMDPKANCFFPLEAVVRLNDEALLDWTLNAALMVHQPTEAEFTRALLRPSEQACFGLGLGNSSPSTVKVCRVTVPDVVHPLVLNALARTPRQEAMRTQAATAIVMAAWPGVQLFYWFDFICHLLDAMMLLWLTFMRVSPLAIENEGYSIGSYSMGGRSPFEQWRRAYLWDGGPHACSLVFVFSIVRKVVEDLVCVAEWKKLGPLRVYLTSGKLSVLLFRWTGIMLLALTVTCELASDDHIQLLPERIILAFAGVVKWVDVMFHLRGLRTWGPKILPILKVFSDVVGFFVVMTFMMIAFAHANYALSRVGLIDVLVNSWRLGLLGDFDLAEYAYNVEDVMGDETGLDAPKHPGFPLLVFLMASFMLTVVLTNIFIGVICNSYDTHANVAVQLFLQRRASMCVDYMLIAKRIRSIRSSCGRRDEVKDIKKPEPQFVWYCHRVADEDGAEDALEGSMRSVMRAEISALKGKMQKGFDTIKRSQAATQGQSTSKAAASTSKAATPTSKAEISHPERLVGFSVLPSTVNAQDSSSYYSNAGDSPLRVDPNGRQANDQRAESEASFPSSGKGASQRWRRRPHVS